MLFMLALLSGVRGAVRSIPDVPFLQDTSFISTYSDEKVATFGQLPISSSEQIIQVENLLVDDSYLLLTNQSLYAFQNNSVVKISQQVAQDSRVKVISPNKFLVATPTEFTECEYSSFSAPQCIKAIPISVGPVRDLDFAFGMAWIGSDKGLFYFDFNTQNLTQVTYVVDPITAISHSSNLLAVGSAMRLYLFNGTAWRYEWVGYIIDDTITSLAFDANNTLWIGNAWSINLMYSNGSFDRICGPSGLPFNNVTSLSFQSSLNAMWAGTTQGAMRYSNGSWKYYFGARWIWGSKVASIASSPSTYSTIVVVDGGVSNITFEYWTLASKAEFYQNMVQSPSHLRMGLAGQCPLSTFGVAEGCVQTPDDNDGLWTSMYLASQAYRYAVTKSPDAKADAWASFEAMERLNNVSGVPGLPARSFAPDSGTPLKGDWWLNSTTTPGMMWKGNTSSDELVGHFFVYPLFHDLVCETDEERERPLQLIYNITNYIVENNFYLIENGKPTSWGVWNPAEINDMWTWGDERGPNSLQILAWLANAYLYTGEEKFMDAFNDLVNNYGYGNNMVNTKITIPNDINYSDDELIFLSYYTFFYAGGNKFLSEQFDVSLNRAWRIARPIKSSLWNTIYGAYNQEADFDLENVIWTLQNWPLSQIDWPVNNIQRLDYILNLETHIMGGEMESLNLLPWDERSMFVWNGDPFNLQEGSGFTEHIPSSWLLPYWMARYHGFITDN